MCRLLPLLVVGVLRVQGKDPLFSLDCGPAQGVWLPPMAAVPGTPPSPPSPPVAGLLGIPFAAPPLGRSGRWKPPRDPQCWDGTFNASIRPVQCVQWKNLAVSPPLSPMSEDCLRLNVFTSSVPTTTPDNATAAPLLPIFFWLYGGDNTMGSTAFYGPVENLVSLYDGQAIVVTSNFRVGNFGFLALNQLSKEDPRGVSGNYALLDIQQALRWVQTNAAAFGGDKSKVTLIGQSSGGTNILALMASPASKNLFSAGISLSGSPNITMSLAAAEAQDQKFVENVHCDGAADVLDCLYALSALEVAAMSPNEWDFGGASIPPLGTTPNTKPSREGLVIVDGVTIVQPLLDALAAGIIDVPMIVQTMAAETDFEPKSNVANWTAHDFSGFVTSTFSGWGPRVVDGINAAHANAAQENAAEAYYALDADIGITCGSAAVAVAASSGAPVYLAQVVQPPAHPYPFFPGRKSLFPFHMFDFITAFGTWGLPYLPGATYTPGPTDLALGAMLRTAWLELATTGEIASAPYQRVNATSIVTAVLRAENPTAEVGWKTDVCAELDRFELGQRYWWVN